MGWLKIQKLEYLETGTQPFYKIKKILTYASDDTFWQVIVCSGGNSHKSVSKKMLLVIKFLLNIKCSSNKINNFPWDLNGSQK